MKIEVRLFATLQEYLPSKAGKHSFRLDIEPGDTIKDILRVLKVPPKIPKIVFVNGKYANEDSIIQPGDVVSVFPPVGGG